MTSPPRLTAEKQLPACLTPDEKEALNRVIVFQEALNDACKEDEEIIRSLEKEVLPRTKKHEYSTKFPNREEVLFVLNETASKMRANGASLQGRARALEDEVIQFTKVWEAFQQSNMAHHEEQQRAAADGRSKKTVAPLVGENLDLELMLAEEQVEAARTEAQKWQREREEAVAFEQNLQKEVDELEQLIAGEKVEQQRKEEQRLRQNEYLGRLWKHGSATGEASSSPRRLSHSMGLSYAGAVNTSAIAAGSLSPIAASPNRDLVGLSISRGSMGGGSETNLDREVARYESLCNTLANILAIPTQK